MTWPDWTLIATLVLFLAIGARLGSLWTAACLGAGFFGAFLADTYALPASSYIGSYAGADWMAAAVLFAAGAVAFLVPGLLLSKVCDGILLGVVDSLFGLFTGAVAGVLAVAVLLLAVMPFVPSVEATRAWRGSSLVMPLHGYLENLMGARGAPHLSSVPKVDLRGMGSRATAGLRGVADRIVARAKG